MTAVILHIEPGFDLGVLEVAWGTNLSRSVCPVRMDFCYLAVQVSFHSFGHVLTGRARSPGGVVAGD